MHTHTVQTDRSEGQCGLADTNTKYFINYSFSFTLHYLTFLSKITQTMSTTRGVAPLLIYLTHLHPFLDVCRIQGWDSLGAVWHIGHRQPAGGWRQLWACDHRAAPGCGRLWAAADGAERHSARRHPCWLYPSSNKWPQFNSVQGGICALREVHRHSTPSLRSFPNVSFETVPMFFWLMMALSRPLKEDHLVLPLSTPFSSRWSMIWYPWLCACR